MEWVAQPRKIFLLFSFVFLYVLLWAESYLPFLHSRTDILAIILAWAIAFTLVMVIILSLGLGPGCLYGWNWPSLGKKRQTPCFPASILTNKYIPVLFCPTGSLAAAFQSFMYGGFTPAGGIFATLTSMAMLGTLMWIAAVFAVVLATGVAATVGVMGVGRR